LFTEYYLRDMKKCLVAILLFAALTFVATEANAQCAMCKAGAETSIQSGSSGAAGINKGILYLFFTPYIVGGVIGFFWWRNKKRAEA